MLNQFFYIWKVVIINFMHLTTFSLISYLLLNSLIIADDPILITEATTSPLRVKYVLDTQDSGFYPSEKEAYAREYYNSVIFPITSQIFA